jgi:hypothetical protein
VKPCGNSAQPTGESRTYCGVLWLAFSCPNHGRIWILAGGLGEPEQTELFERGV